MIEEVAGDHKQWRRLSAEVACENPASWGKLSSTLRDDDRTEEPWVRIDGHWLVDADETVVSTIESSQDWVSPVIAELSESMSHQHERVISRAANSIYHECLIDICRQSDDAQQSGPELVGTIVAVEDT